MTERIISASRRTDIPAFYTPWFMNRIRAGFCVYPNPLYRRTFYRVSLRPDEVLGIVFWTRHAAPLLRHLPELDKAGFTYYFQYTVVEYPSIVHPRSPSLEMTLATFQEVSRQVGPSRIVWRYDPIVLSSGTGAEWHRERFLRIADALSGYTETVMVSVVDPYAKTKRRLDATMDGVVYEPDAYQELLVWMAEESAGRGLATQTCTEPGISIPGVTMGSCVDTRLLCQIKGRPAPSRVRIHRQREGCLCHQSVDIGVNDSCTFGCQYCYATTSHDRAMETLRNHRPEWTSITGDVDIEAIEDSAQRELPL